MRLLTLIIVSGALLLNSCAPTQKSQKQNIKVTTESSTDWSPAEGPLMTRWAKDVSPENVLPEYPRPQMVRETWLNLNGLWQYALGEDLENAPFGEDLDGEILVPFAIESALSGVGERTDHLWYRRTFAVPENWQENRVLLHFGAVDWETIVYVNGEKIGDHKGGFDAFNFDITDYLDEGENELIVEVHDPTDDGDQPRGKQVKEPRGIWYTPVTGIWQTVWLEPVAQSFISGLKFTPDVDNERLDIKVEADGSAEEVRITGYAGDEEIGSVTGKVGQDLALIVADPELWTPDNPFLYDLKVELLNGGEVVDEVESYFGMRKVEINEDEDGIAKIMLNDEFVYQLGPLDQGYWPDGLYTAPTDEALRYDLEITKRLGFNMNRKHVKIEPARWYYWADKLGVLIWQDMVTGSNATPESKVQFELELEEMVNQFYNHPSIVNWVIFNEGWGQYDTERITQNIEEMDESRIITDASGWQHHSVGDIIDVHRYPGPAALKPASDRAAVVGEFGGVGYVINDHTWGGDGWGYQDIIREPEAFIDRYEELLHKLLWLSEEYGMSGGVYTQLTDLETELNGMLTYDREITKAAPQQFASVNKGITPYIHPAHRDFIEEIEVEIYNWSENTEIRYTRDGSEVDSTSDLYEEPFTINKSTTVRARSFQNGLPIGYANSADFSKVPGKDPNLDDAGGLEQGLTLEYYEHSPDQEPTYRKHWPLRRLMAGERSNLTPKKEGVTKDINLEQREREELFGFIFRGYIEVPEDGDYIFHLAADDDASLQIGESQIFDRLGQSPDTSYESARISLKKGLHEIEMRYFQAYGPYELKLSLEGPGLETQPVSDEMLYHRD